MTAAERRVAIALLLHRAGIPVISLNGKIPTTPGWQKIRAADQTEEEVAEMARRGNIGMPTGSASGIAVVDIDDPENAEAIAQELGLDEQPTWVVRTGGGGLQLYFRIPAGIAVKNSVKRVHPMVDIRGDGGQVVLPGSIHPDTGRMYDWLAPELSPAEVPDPASLPAPFLTRLQDATPQSLAKSLPDSDATEVFQKLHPTMRVRLLAWANSALQGECEKVANAKPGTRNKTLFASACRLHELANTGLLDADEVDSKLREAARKCGL